MKNKKVEGILIILCGLICIAAAGYIYFIAHSVYPDSDSSRVQDLNRLLNTFWKTGTAIAFAIPGLIAVYAGIKKFRSKK